MGKHWPLVPNVYLAALGHVSLYLWSPRPPQSLLSCGLLALVVELPSSLFPCGVHSSLEVAEGPLPFGWNIARDSFSLEFLK